MTFIKCYMCSANTVKASELAHQCRVTTDSNAVTTALKRNCALWFCLASSLLTMRTDFRASEHSKEKVYEVYNQFGLSWRAVSIMGVRICTSRTPVNTNTRIISTPCSRIYTTLTSTHKYYIIVRLRYIEIYGI